MKIDRTLAAGSVMAASITAFLASGLLPAPANAAINCVKPPVLSNPLVFKDKCPEDSGGPGSINARGRDVYITLPRNRTCHKRINIEFPRHVRISGGHIVFDDPNSAVINISQTSGKSFIDGMLIDVNKRSADAIRVYRHKGALFVQNTHIKGVSGTQNGIHGDITHAQGDGPLRNLVLQNVTGLTGYQGLFAPYRPGEGHGTHRLRLHRVNFAYDPALSKSSGAKKPLILLFMGSADDSRDRVPDRGTYLSNVWVDGSYWNFPYTNAVYARPSSGSGGCATFAAKHKINGRACGGKPPKGDFAPISQVGRNYNRATFCKN